MQHGIDAAEMSGPGFVVKLEIGGDDRRVAASVPVDLDHLPALEPAESGHCLAAEIAGRAGDQHALLIIPGRPPTP